MSKSPSRSGARSSRDRVRVHRAKLRKQGLRPIQIWVPDVHSEGFKADVRRQCLAISNSPQEREDMAFIESLIGQDDH
jgi:antidote-toxin recognition MazE-like antitoxin